ncbi:hypothetical protein KIL84_016058 [Mauremys mutica]|uniref:Uncharacterized protein n=1 Tax=Mauremys mutica TaxID=74926 RepID=A0A9D3WTU7_9SAUR|nr:hypothetical protein KIL84_016058 [Mauremys mutica]
MSNPWLYSQQQPESYKRGSWRAFASRLQQTCTTHRFGESGLATCRGPLPKEMPGAVHILRDSTATHPRAGTQETPLLRVGHRKESSFGSQEGPTEGTGIPGPLTASSSPQRGSLCP